MEGTCSKMSWDRRLDICVTIAFNVQCKLFLILLVTQLTATFMKKITPKHMRSSRVPPFSLTNFPANDTEVSTVSR